MKSHTYYVHRLIRDLWVVLLSIVLAVILVRTGALQTLINAAEGAHILGSFLAGIFFTSGFTIAPASVALLEIAKTTPPLLVALWGAIGATVGDLIIFFFIRDAFVDDLVGAFKTSHTVAGILSHLHFALLRWVLPIIGAIIIASPLPDELGLACLGVSKIRIRYLIPLAFVFNFIGIIVITLFV
ncbi:MAG: hypothetical protein AAB460_00625 [Patescibacteria group bacterium]